MNRRTRNMGAHCQGQFLLCAGLAWLVASLVTIMPRPASGQSTADTTTPAGAASQSAITLGDLRCEYLRNPHGIDVVRPRLGWALQTARNTARGQAQHGYHVLVASTAQLLDQDAGDLWDSGPVHSSQSQQVIYAGRPLEYGTRCFWKVRVQDQADHWSAWSPTAHWSMGPLQPGDWRAKWIGAAAEFQEIKKLPPPEDALFDPWLRKVIDLDAKPVRALVTVASVGYHELYVNGQKVSDTLLVPNVSDHTQRARYASYEISGQLQAGRNVIGLWLGTSWSVYPLYKTEDKPQTPIVIAQARIELAGGDIVWFGTDESWKTRPSPSALLGVWNFMNFGGEYYDGARELPGWCTTDVDDTDWAGATVYHPKLTLSADMAEPNRRIKKIVPIAIQPLDNGDFRIDMGVNFAGVLEFDVRGEPGDLVEMRFSEREDQAMTHRLHSAIRLGPTGQATFQNRFNYLSGRWIQVSGLRGRPELRDIRGYLVRSDYERAATFRCDHQLLNDIYDTTLWTFESLSLGGYVVDCPQRERMGYGGDAHATTPMALANYRLGAFYTKWMQDWRDVQNRASSWGVGTEADRKDEAGNEGNLPYTAPTYWGGGGPAWSGICVTMPWFVYRHYGDRRILEQSFPTIQRWLAFLETKSRDNLLVRWGGKWDFLGDWLWPGADGVNGDTRETLFFNNCYWVYNLQTAARIADVLEDTERAAAYRQRANEVRQAIHREFYDAAEHGYVNNLQAYLAIALLVDVPPQQERAAVWRRLEDEILIHRNGHFWGGITGGAFLVLTLLEFDRSDLMLLMASQEDYPGWGNMLRQGATTIWEAWDGRNSRLHSSYLHVGTWFIEGLAGIRPDPAEPGYRHIILKPGIVTDGQLHDVQARFVSPYGPISSRWQLRNGRLELAVTIPANTTATLYLPTSDPASARESGRALDDAAGVHNVRREPARCVLDLAAGSYSFQATP